MTGKTQVSEGDGLGVGGFFSFFDACFWPGRPAYLNGRDGEMRVNGKGQALTTAYITTPKRKWR